MQTRLSLIFILPVCFFFFLKLVWVYFQCCIARCSLNLLMYFRFWSGYEREKIHLAGGLPCMLTAFCSCFLDFFDILNAFASLGYCKVAFYIFWQVGYAVCIFLTMRLLDSVKSGFLRNHDLVAFLIRIRFKICNSFLEIWSSSDFKFSLFGVESFYYC